RADRADARRVLDPRRLRLGIHAIPARRIVRMVAPRWPRRPATVIGRSPLAASSAWSRLAGREDPPPSSDDPRSPLRAFYRVAEEHGDGRRPHAADPGRDVA